MVADDATVMPDFEDVTDQDAIRGAGAVGNMESWSVENWIAVIGLILALIGIIYRVGRMEGAVQASIDELKDDVVRVSNDADNRYGEVRLALHAHEEECGKREERHAASRVHPSRSGGRDRIHGEQYRRQG